MAGPQPISAVKPSVKRKRQDVGKSSSRKRAKSESDGDEHEDDGQQAQILLLENEILESKKNYNNIATLIEIMNQGDKAGENSVLAAVALCRVFIRLLAAGKLVKKKDLAEKDVLVVRWLRERLEDYKQAILPMLRRDEAALTALTLAMRILKAEAQHLEDRGEYIFPKAFLINIVAALLEPAVDNVVREEFIENFVDQYDDIRFYTFYALREILVPMRRVPAEEGVLNNIFEFLIGVEGIPDSSEELDDFYVDPPKQKKHVLHSLTQHKKQAQEAWLALLNLGLSKDQRKKVLEIMSTSIAPWFAKPELLMDFLTDCYDAGGSMSLLALSGVFYLMKERNLDYPAFYKKLYSLLDADILHSKHRSRFFRLLDTFLASTHLPAALVASFIKRLSRLALNAPPAAIVVIVPWFYNLFKNHPLCTFMMHRVPRTPEEKEQIESEGLEDPFLPDEEDPMETHAIDSCLWEIVQLQSHYHPNVATITKIISEQFTKQFYNMEDFLDHSYGSLLDAEMAKQMKKPPVVEFMIPKRIFTRHDDSSEEQNSLLVNLWNFGTAPS